MAITSSPFFWYNKAPKHLSLPGLLTDDIKVALVTSSYTPNAATHEYFDVSITNELTTANGYTAGGLLLTTKALTETATPGQWKFTSDDPLWSITGAGLTHRLWILYNNTPASNKPLLGYGYSDYNSGTPQDVTTAAGFDLTIVLPADGWFSTTKVNGA